MLSHIEALIFSAIEPVSVEEIQTTLNEVYDTNISTKTIENLLQSLIEKYQEEQYAFSIMHIGGGYVFLTKPIYQPIIAHLLKEKTKKKTF